MRRLHHQLQDEQGAITVFVALLMVSLLVISAIAVDIGLWMNTRSEAQRVADSAALAGAGLWLKPDEPTLTAVEDTARYFASRNYVGRSTVISDQTLSDNDVDVEIIAARRLVRVTVRGRTPSLLARYFGLNELGVVGRAAARVFNVGGSTCVKPFALPDMWQENGNDKGVIGLFEPGEDWSFDPAVDQYRRWQDDAGTGVETGYGSGFRNGLGSPPYTGDQGRQIVIKAGEPAGGNNGTNYDVPFNIRPGIFLPFVLPDNPPDDANCGLGGNAGIQGAAVYSQNICACNPSVVNIGGEYPLKTGNMVGPTKAGITDLIGLDPNASWNSSTNTVNSQYGEESPRVIKIALYDPAEVIASGKQSVTLNNIALFFLEGYENNTKNVIGRFMKYADGSAAAGPTSTPLARILQLVE